MKLSSAKNIAKIAKRCHKPCYYNHYMFVGEKGTFAANERVPGSMLFGVESADDYISIESEELVYPWTSLVAEIGGTLGLFVGFSFIMVWDGVEMVWQWRNIFEKWCKH